AHTLEFLLFQHLVYISTGFLSYIIPDVPYSLRTQINREKTVLREAQYELDNNPNSMPGAYRRPSTVGQALRRNGLSSRRGSVCVPEEDP
ncbi:Anoctamin, partial [Caligus rogercresseyi]